MKKALLICFCFLACTSKKEKIINMQKEVLEEKAKVEKLLEATKDSSYPTKEQFRQWDSLYKCEDSLTRLYDSLQKELSKQ